MTLYKTSDAKDSCGFGLMAHLDGIQSHRLIDTAVTALTRMTHRGAIHTDGKTGDGCGISVQLSKSFFRKIAEDLGFILNEKFAVGLVFFNPDPAQAAKSKRILEEELERETLTICGWREVPIDTSVCGESALSTLPKIEQVFVTASPGWGDYDLERRLFMARRRASDRSDDEHYYVSSLSGMMIIYKALVMPKFLTRFYPDLNDPDFKSAICLFHQRFSTNTAPLWRFAQPFRYLAHNGEINTISANRRWTIARQKKLYTPLLPDLGNLKHLVNLTGSDSSSLDNMLEVLLTGGMDIFRALRLLVPPAWADHSNMDPDLKAFYEFNSMHSEPWDGPAGIVMTNGTQVACTLDRNGLRPARYVITKDRILTVASEIGVWDYDETDVVEKDRVGPGEMLAANIATGEIWRTKKIDDMLKTRHPYLEWLRENIIRLRSSRYPNEANSEISAWNKDRLAQYEKYFGVSIEEKEHVIRVMANQGQEATGSMGDDTPIAVLSQRPRNLFDYFRQQFAQVTNPPIDPLREKSVMSLATNFGREHNVFQETSGLAHRAIIDEPILDEAKLQQLINLDQKHYQQQTLSLGFAQTESLENAIKNLCDKAVQLVKRGCVILRLNDNAITPGDISIHASLAVGAVHNRLIDEGLRCDTNIIIETGSCRDPHQFAVLIGVGATAVYPYLSLQIINDLHQRQLLEFDLISAQQNYFKGINKGLLKIMSKMGISTVASYRGANLFEAVGIDQSVIDLCFSGMPARIGGATFNDIQQDTIQTVQRAWLKTEQTGRSGELKFVYGGEYHCYNPDVVQTLQEAVASGQYRKYLQFAKQVNQRPVSTLRDLMQLKPCSIPLDSASIESKNTIMRRFDSAGMSIGALSPEAHEALAIAMNQIGGRSNSGEGGEDPARFNTIKNSKIKQIASGRFGVTAHYLMNAEVLQIKIAQGAKPGEGGQLPGQKASLEIARLRNSTPGITLISPPPHHDIYSIEDIAQLIFDLKQINPQALISVKLVSGPGVGTIAAGVAKAYADMITIAGHDGGTGASPLTSVKYAGTPWEIGLSEAHQALIENKLRDRVCLQVDGGLKTGLDVIKGAILGADSFGFGTAPMIALGCKYLRICHLNNCATGVATQNPTLRKRHFNGLPERVIRYFEFIAQETQEWLAKLGMPSLNQLIGRTDLLEIIQGASSKQNHLNLDIILKSARRPDESDKAAHYQGIRNTPFDQGKLNQTILTAVKNSETDKLVLRYSIKNHDRSVGATLAGYLAQNNGQNKEVKIEFTGIAGQSFGVWNTKGMHLKLQGDANDYVAKGMSGGSISIFPADNIQYVASRGAIIGNTCLYGACGGELYAAGQAGERFAVRNSGANAVVEGAGDHACEYMTGGTILILGPVGQNFAAGMTGGLAFVLDLRETLYKSTNLEHVDVFTASDKKCKKYLPILTELLDKHIENTNSPWGCKVKNNLAHYLYHFMIVIPKSAHIDKPSSKSAIEKTLRLIR